MKTAAFAIVSLISAAIVYIVVFTITWLLLWAADSLLGGKLLVIPPNAVAEFIMVFLPALATGVILGRVKPFFMPMVTVPLALMAYWGVVTFFDRGPGLASAIGFVASVGFVSLLGCGIAWLASRPPAKRGEIKHRPIDGQPAN